MLIEITYNVTDVYMSTTETPVYVEISFEQPGGGAAVWGSITGTLSDQTDLQNALNAKVPYSGATGDVSLGEYGINVGNVIYDTTPTGILTEQGATYWDADAETVALIMNGTIQKVGEDTFYHVRNTTGSTIAKGTAVRFSGTTGNSGRLLIAPMLADGTYPSQYYMGITSEELVNNADGKVYHFGKMRNINTSAFADGDVLYVSPSVAGALTATAPVAPNNIIVAAAVVHAANNGTLMIRTTLGSNINADEGVLLTTPTANQGLFYDSGLWVNKSITTALGYTPANAATTITINGVTYDLSTSRTWTIATGISGSGASGQVTYWTGASAVSGSNNLFWDNANGRLGIGTISPEEILTISASNPILRIRENTGVATSISGIRLLNSVNNQTDINLSQSNLTPLNRAKAAQLIISNNGTGGIALTATSTNANATIDFITQAFPSASASILQARITNAGNFLMGSTTDNGQRLQVYGDTLLRGSGATSATTALTVQNSDSNPMFYVENNGGTYVRGRGATNVFFVQSSAGGNLFYIQNAGVIGFTTYTWTPEGTSATVILTASASRSWNISGDKNNTSGVGSAFFVTSGFNPTSGTGVYNAQTINPIINQTGGANGITRGLYVNPTLTSAADFRAIEVSAGITVLAPSVTARASLRIPSGTAPTSPNDGDIWFDGTDIKMRIGGVTKTFTLL